MKLSDAFSSPLTRSIGVDVTGASIRCVSVRRRGLRIVVERAAESPRPANAFTGTDISSIDQAGSAVRAAIATTYGAHARSLRGAFVGLPDIHSFMKVLSVPSRDASMLDEAIRWETTQHIPYELKELSIDWTKIARGSSSESVQALVAAAPTVMVDQYRTMLAKGGLDVFGLEPTPVSVVRASEHVFPATGATLLLYLGELESFGIVVVDGVPRMTATVHVTTTHLIDQIADQFHVSAADAAKSLYTFGLYKLRARGLVRELLRASIDDLVKRLREVIEYSSGAVSGNQQITSILMVGDGTYIAGISDEIAAKMKLPVQIVTAPTTLRITKHTRSFIDYYHRFAVAYGLACNALAIQ